MGKKFNFFKDVYDPLAKRVKPIAKPLLGLLADKAGEKIQSLKTGGRVKGKKNAPKKVLAHGGEFILPVGVKPTMAQKKEVAKRKARSKK
jgi:hypothetical protein